MTYECIGSIAAEPYYIEGVCLNIFSIEELCYYLKENVTLLDDSIMSDTLVDFIADELKLSGLAEKLADMIHSGAALPDFVGEIMEYTDYVSGNTLIAMKKAVNGSPDIKPGMKRKARGDFFFRNGKYPEAAQEYLQAVYADTQQAEVMGDNKALAVLYHDLGSAYARMFIFDNAADSFKKAYSLNHSSVSLKCYLLALRMDLDRDAYTERIMNEQIPEEAADETEKIMSAGTEGSDSAGDLSGVDGTVLSAEDADEWNSLSTLSREALSLHGAGQISDYLKKTGDLMYRIKDGYRKRQGK